MNVQYEVEHCMLSTYMLNVLLEAGLFTLVSENSGSSSKRLTIIIFLYQRKHNRKGK